MDRVQGGSQKVPAEMNTRRDFARGGALLWKELSSILAQEVRSMLSQKKEYPIYILRGTTTHVVGKLLSLSPHAMRNKLRGSRQ